MKFLFVFYVIFLSVLCYLLLCCVVLRDRRLAQQTKVTSFMQIRILTKKKKSCIRKPYMGSWNKWLHYLSMCHSDWDLIFKYTIHTAQPWLHSKESGRTGEISDKKWEGGVRVVYKSGVSFEHFLCSCELILWKVALSRHEPMSDRWWFWEISMCYLLLYHFLWLPSEVAQTWTQRHRSCYLMQIILAKPWV